MSEKEAISRVHEALEIAEVTHGNKGLAPVSLTMAILAVFVATLSLLGHREHNEVLLIHLQANYEKAGLAGITTRRHADGILIDMLAVLHPHDTAKATELREKFDRERHRYATEEAKINESEERLAAEGQRAHRKAERFDIAELFCEMALILCSITLLVQQRAFWYGGLLVGSVGLIIAVSAFLITSN